MTDEPIRTRNRRFERAPGSSTFQITERDEQILLAIGDHRFLNSRQIQALVPGSDQKILRRLTGLFHHGYLDRPKAQIDTFHILGNRPMTYALSDTGARYVNDRFGADHVERGWRRKNIQSTRPFVDHTLAIADFDVALKTTLQQRHEIERIDAPALIAAFPTPPASSDKAFHMRAQVRRNDNVMALGVNPDYAFALHSVDISRRCYLVEIDRGKMPIVRSDFLQPSILRKFATYIAAHGARRPLHQFGWRAYRVLLVTTTAERAANMRRALADYTKARELRQMFYFTDAPSLLAADILSHRWIDGNDEPQTLI